MNKKLMVIAVASVMAMPLAVNAAGKTKFYGVVHLSVDKLADSGLTIDGGAAKTNRIGAKGSMSTNIADFKSIYQIEVGFPVGKDKTTYRERNTFVGLSSKSMGTIRIGTVTTSYKASGKFVDPLFTTTAEGRGAMGLMSKLHAGYGTGGQGRASQTVRYDSPKIAGAKIIGTYTIADGVDDNVGVGLRYKTGPVAVFFDYLNVAAIEKTAMKVGAKAKFGPATIALQYEFNDDGLAKTGRVKNGDKDEGNILFVAATYSMGASSFIATLGNNDERLGYAVAVKQKLNKKSAVYVGYAGSDDGAKDDNAITVGMVHKF